MFVKNKSKLEDHIIECLGDTIVLGFLAIYFTVLGFIPSDDGCLTCRLSGLEVMGRDISVVSRHNSSKNDTIRSIISSNNDVDENAANVKFDIRPNKIFLFAKTEGEERVYFEEA